MRRGLPLDEERINEARVVIPFWQKAINDPDKALIHRASMEQWFAEMLKYLSEARQAGTISTAVDDATLVGQLLNFLLGAQISAALAPDGRVEPGLNEQLQGFLALLGCEVSPTTGQTCAAPKRLCFRGHQRSGRGTGSWRR